jgi:hypothetical protein
MNFYNMICIIYNSIKNTFIFQAVIRKKEYIFIQIYFKGSKFQSLLPSAKKQSHKEVILKWKFTNVTDNLLEKSQ